MNSGAIPSIENTWNMMCKIETNKALEASEKIYEDYLKEKFDTEIINEQSLLVF